MPTYSANEIRTFYIKHDVKILPCNFFAWEMFTILNHSEVVTIPSTSYYNVLVTHVKKWNCVLLGTFRQKTDTM